MPNSPKEARPPQPPPRRPKKDKRKASGPIYYPLLSLPAEEQPEDRIGLCLSGGGYRAMLFHLGALWRLNEVGQLAYLSRISSVSGGSITAAFLGRQWQSLMWQRVPYGRAATNFQQLVVKPLRELARQTIDFGAVVGGIFTAKTIAEKIVERYDEHLFRGATLQDLPDDALGPRFVINATDVQNGSLWRFSKPDMRDYRVGEVKKPIISLATAVAASSAFPTFLSPFVLQLSDAAFTIDSGYGRQRPPFTTSVYLTDSGVYDNLGLETVWKNHRTVLVSDGGGRIADEEKPADDWARHFNRVLEIVDQQVRSQLIAAFEDEARSGAYWGITTDIAGYGLDDALVAPFERTVELAATATALKELPDRLQDALINWGYAVCDAALRAYVADYPAPADFPYAGGV